MPRSKYEPTSRDLSRLRRVETLTQRMRQREEEVMKIGARRRDLLIKLRDRGVPWKLITDAAGTTEQALYKSIRWGKTEEDIS